MDWSWLSDNLALVWLGVAIVLLVTELVSLDFVLVMLAVGAGAGAAAAGVGLSPVLQVLIAAGVSVGMLGVVRPRVIERFHAGPELRSGHQRMIGEAALVVKAVEHHETGTVRINGELWSARALDERDSMAEGEMVDILEVRGATVYVVQRPTLGPTPD